MTLDDYRKLHEMVEEDFEKIVFEDSPINHADVKSQILELDAVLKSEILRNCIFEK